MKAIKGLGVMSFCLLTACASTKQHQQQQQRPQGQQPKLEQQGQMQETAANDPATQKKVPLEKRKAQTATVSTWEIQGAMAAKGKGKGWSATMDWVQHGPHSYQLRLMGPIGSGTVLINKKGGHITVQDGKKTTSSNNADGLLLKETGIQLPVDNMYYWVRGMAAPGGGSSEKHDEYNHLTQLNQSGYSIQFSQYTSVKGVDLPRRIHLEGKGVTVKIMIKNWNV